MGVWPPVSTRQDMGCTIRGGPAHKIKAFTALLSVHRKLLYSTKYDTFLVTLPPPEYIRRGRGLLADKIHRRSIYYRSIQYTKDIGRRVLRRSDGPNLSKSLSLRLVSPSGSWSCAPPLTNLPLKGPRMPPRGGVNWANSKFSCNNQILRIAQLTPCA